MLEIRTWGKKWKRVIDKTMEWATWQWANMKMDKENLSTMRQSVNISKDDMEDYNLAMFTHAMNFFKECASLKKLILKHFFTSLLNDLSIEDLLTFGNLISIEFMKPRRWLYLIPRRQVWVWQELRKKVLKQPVNHRMIGLAPKPRNMYNNNKNDKSQIEWKTKILFFTLICSTIDVWRWIFVQSMRSHKENFMYEKFK